MLLAGLFAGGLFLLLVVGDWRRFSRWTASASRYGCPVARAEDALENRSMTALAAFFDADGLLPLDHGLARLFPDARRILFAPRTHRSLSRFRTVWPLKGLLELDTAGDAMRLRCVKLMPWSSALVTLLWFALVGVGTLAFVVRFLLEDGAGSLGGLLLGAGIAGVGLLVLAFGLVTVSLAYRLEDQRLMQAYQELRAVLSGEASAPDTTGS